MPTIKKAVKPKTKKPVKKTGGKKTTPKPKSKQIVKGLSLSQKAILATILGTGVAAATKYYIAKKAQTPVPILQAPPPKNIFKFLRKTPTVITPSPLERMPGAWKY